MKLSTSGLFGPIPHLTPQSTAQAHRPPVPTRHLVTWKGTKSGFSYGARPPHTSSPVHLSGHKTGNALTNTHHGRLNLATLSQAHGNTVAGPSPACALGSPMTSPATGWHWERGDNHL